ncbi:hypothetical protein EDD64_11737 [Effusibacillus lacus]|nr:hypothetical protein EDD64_11737 [Effusibacillus lacus]
MTGYPVQDWGIFVLLALISNIFEQVLINWFHKVKQRFER